MHIDVLYFSGTGNSAWVAGRLAETLRGVGADVALENLETAGEGTGLKGLVVLVHPIYGATLPRIVVDRMRGRLGGDTKLAVVATFGYVNALGYFAERRLLGAPIWSYVNVRMWNNITTPRLPSRIVPAADRARRKAELERRVDGVAADIMAGRRLIQGLGPWLLGGIVIRRHSVKALKRSWAEHSVDMSRCTRCGLCVSSCPTHAISESADGLVFGEDCTACMRCYNNCPSHAVLMGGIFADPAHYVRYRGPWAADEVKVPVREGRWMKG